MTSSTHTQTHTSICKHVRVQPGVDAVRLAECYRYSFMTSSRGRPLLLLLHRPALLKTQGGSFILNQAGGETQRAHSSPRMGLFLRQMDKEKYIGWVKKKESSGVALKKSIFSAFYINCSNLNIPRCLPKAHFRHYLHNRHP